MSIGCSFNYFFKLFWSPFIVLVCLFHHIKHYRLNDFYWTQNTKKTQVTFSNITRINITKNFTSIYFALVKPLTNRLKNIMFNPYSENEPSWPVNFDLHKRKQITPQSFLRDLSLPSRLHWIRNMYNAKKLIKLTNECVINSLLTISINS